MYNSDRKKTACNEGDRGFIPGQEDSLEKEMAINPLQYACLGNPMDKGAWQTIARGVTKSWTWLSCQHTHM